MDVSWNEAWTHTEQLRFFELMDKILTFTTRVTDPLNGTTTQHVVVWEPVAVPRDVAL